MGALQRQLDTIAALQRHLLPRSIPQPPGWQVELSYTVGSCPGGNYYDFLPLRDGRIVIFLADASDEGGPSAVLVAIARVVMHSCPLNSGVERLPFCPVHGEVIQPPHIILDNLNRVLVENTLAEQYLTAFCGILSPAEGTLHFANAGHVPPRWWRAARRVIEPVRDVKGLPLGLGYHSTYHHKRIEIEPGDLLVLPTDGLAAAQNLGGELFGTWRLDEAIHDLAGRGAEALRTGLVSRLDDFLAASQPRDDVTILILERVA
jgi:sigma-B regulation protein RsbU (phosphoserine phosphatase)